MGGSGSKQNKAAAAAATTPGLKNMLAMYADLKKIVPTKASEFSKRVAKTNRNMENINEMISAMQRVTANMGKPNLMTNATVSNVTSERAQFNIQIKKMVSNAAVIDGVAKIDNPTTTQITAVADALDAIYKTLLALKDGDALTKDDVDLWRRLVKSLQQITSETAALHNLNISESVLVAMQHAVQSQKNMQNLFKSRDRRTKIHIKVDENGQRNNRA